MPKSSETTWKGFSSNSHWCCHDSTVCCNRLWKEAEGQLEYKDVCTTQSRLSFAKTQVPPRECLATYVLLRKEVANQGVIAINTTCDEQICKFKFIVECLSSSLDNQLYEGRDCHHCTPAPGIQEVLNKYIL